MWCTSHYRIIQAYSTVLLVPGLALPRLPSLHTSVQSWLLHLQDIYDAACVRNESNKQRNKHTRAYTHTHAHTRAHTQCTCTVLTQLPERSRGPLRCRRGEGASRVVTEKIWLDAKPTYVSKPLNPRTLAKRVMTTRMSSPQYSEWQR